jgi:hypothetical protein
LTKAISDKRIQGLKPYVKALTSATYSGNIRKIGGKKTGYIIFVPPLLLLGIENRLPQSHRNHRPVPNTYRQGSYREGKGKSLGKVGRKQNESFVLTLKTADETKTDS